MKQSSWKVALDVRRQAFDTPLEFCRAAPKVLKMRDPFGLWGTI
jgi:hypothetical protein